MNPEPNDTTTQTNKTPPTPPSWAEAMEQAKDRADARAREFFRQRRENQNPESKHP